jgi:hypothetical protein
MVRLWRWSQGAKGMEPIAKIIAVPSEAPHFYPNVSLKLHTWRRGVGRCYGAALLPSKLK